MQQLPTRKKIIQTLFEKWNPEQQTETISIDAALNRILARDYEAVYSIPVVRASAMDGVAVVAERFAQGIPDTSAWKLGEDFCRADTGDDFDDRFDAVIPIEDVYFFRRPTHHLAGSPCKAKHEYSSLWQYDSTGRTSGQSKPCSSFF